MRCQLSLLSLPLLLSAPLLLAGCHSAPIVASSPNLRQLQIGDRWQFRLSPELHRSLTTRMEIVTASPAAFDGSRSLTLRIRKRYWGRLPGYPRGWQQKEGDFTLRQAADGSLSGGESLTDGARGALDQVTYQFPPRVPSPLVAGKSFDTGWVRDERYSERTVSRVVGQERIESPLGRFVAWRIDTTHEWRDESRQRTIHERWSDWYDGDRYLLRRQNHTEMPDDKVFTTLTTFVSADERIDQIPWTPDPDGQ